MRRRGGTRKPLAIQLFFTQIFFGEQRAMLNASCTSHKYWCFPPSTFTCQRFLRTCSTACMLICVRRRCQGYFAKGSTIRWLWKCDGRNAIAPWRIDSKRASTYKFKNNSFAIMLKGSYTVPFFKAKNSSSLCKEILLTVFLCTKFSVL